MDQTTTDISLYDQNDYYRSSQGGQRLSWIFTPLLVQLDRLRAFHTCRRAKTYRGRALDFGAGEGGYLHFLKRRGFEVRGTTASRVSQSTARVRYGIELLYTTEVPPELLERPFDLVSYWHVFEHLAAPERHAGHWSQLLAQTGTLVVEVPNTDSLGARLCFDSWLGSDTPHHINPVSAEQLRRFVEARGLKIYCEEHFSLKFSYVFLWSAWLGFFFGRKRYRFSFLENLLKTPLVCLRKHPLRSFNAVFSLGYLAPLVMLSLIAGILFQRGEVVRIYARKKT